MVWYFAGLKIWTIAHCAQWNSAVKLIKNVKAFWWHVTDQEVLSRSTFHLQMGKPQLSLIHISLALFWVSKVAAQILVWALQQAFIRASKKSGASRKEREGGQPLFCSKPPHRPPAGKPAPASLCSRPANCTCDFLGLLTQCWCQGFPQWRPTLKSATTCPARLATPPDASTSCFMRRTSYASNALSSVRTWLTVKARWWQLQSWSVEVLQN